MVSIHYWKPALCRVTEALPSVFYRALGKDGICRVRNKIHSAKKHSTKMALPSVFFGTRQNASLSSAFFRHSAKCVFAECLFSGTRQRCILPNAIFWHSAKCVFAECLFFGTRQIGFLPCAFFLALGKSFFSKQFLRP